MSEYTRAVFGALQSGEADFASTYSRLESVIVSLDSQLNSSLSQWDGQAQEAYHVAKAQWDAAMANMADVLNRLRAVIGDAHMNYSSTEAANASLWNG